MTSDKPNPAADWRTRRATCQAGNHSDRCPAITCPVKAAWTPDEKAAYAQRRQDAGLPPAPNADRWDAYREHKAMCLEGKHSDFCPDKVCPVKKRWNKAMWAEYRQRRREAMAPNPAAFVPGVPDYRHEMAKATLQGLPAGGWKSPQVVLPLAQQIKDRLLNGPDCPAYLLEPRYEHALNSWAVTEAQLQLAWRKLDEISMEMAEAEEATEEEMIEQVTRQKRKRVTITMRRDSLSRTIDMLERRASSLRRELGLTPASAARIGADVSRAKFDLALMLEEYRKRQELESAEGGDAGQQRPRAIPPGTPLAG